MDFNAPVVETDPLLLWAAVDFTTYPASTLISNDNESSPDTDTNDFPTFLAEETASGINKLSHKDFTNVKDEIVDREIASLRKRKMEEVKLLEEANNYSNDEDIDQEEKRRRNSAASARFRLKKKMKEQKLENIAKLMTDKADVLQKRVRILEAEVKYLRDLLTMRRDREKEDQVLELANHARNENLTLAAIEPRIPESDEELIRSSI